MLNSKDMRIYHPHIKIAAVPPIKPGVILIAQRFGAKEEFQRAVILILEHDESGTTGVILNKLSNLAVQQALPDIGFSDKLYYGGSMNIDRVGFIHHNYKIKGFVRITDSIFWGGHYSHLRTLTQNGEIQPGDIKFFAGLVEWKPGQLHAEINDKHWWIDSITLSELLEKDSSSLWSFKLMTQENLYGLLYEIPEPVLN